MDNGHQPSHDRIGIGMLINVAPIDHAQRTLPHQVRRFVEHRTKIFLAATAHQNDLWVVYGVVIVFVFNRVLDNFFFIPLTVGRSIRMHPLPTVLMVFIGGAVAGIPGLILALPLAGVVGTIVGTIAGIVSEPRLRARNAYARALRDRQVTADLIL